MQCSSQEVPRLFPPRCFPPRSWTGPKPRNQPKKKSALGDTCNTPRLNLSTVPASICRKVATKVECSRRSLLTLHDCAGGDEQAHPEAGAAEAHQPPLQVVVQPVSPPGPLSTTVAFHFCKSFRVKIELVLYARIFFTEWGNKQQRG